MSNAVHQPSLLSNMKIGLKVWLPVIVFILAFISIGVFTLSTTYEIMVEDRKDKVRSIVEAASSTVMDYYNAAQNGEMSAADAQHSALEALRAIRYNDVEYLFVINTQAHVVMHPIKPSLEGKDLIGFKDPEGTPLFKNLADATKSGGGFVPYMWALPNAKEGDPPVKKISYISPIPGWNWGVGSGLYLIDVDKAFQAQVVKYVIIAVAALVIAGTLSFFVARNVTFGLKRLSGEMSVLADGELDLDISGVKRKDEVGGMARSVQVFQDHAIRARELEQANEQQKLQAEAEKKRLMEKMANDFEGSVASIVQKVHHGATHIISTAQNMSKRIDKGSSRTIDVAEASNRTRSNVQTVAASAEQLSSSVAEINRQVSLGSDLASTAATEADQTNVKVQGLSDAAQKIGEVVGLINDIADQTNLLALNATIEAARAGEAGKGFAVVASEVKNLANQTAKATEEIGVQITDMQSATTDSVTAIHGFGKIISEINESTSATAHSVEQQGLATQEIAQNTREVSDDVNLVSNAVGDVSRSSAQSYSSSIKVLWAGQDLEKITSDLSSVVDEFLGKVRA